MDDKSIDKQYLVKNIIVTATRIKYEVAIEACEDKIIAREGDFLVTFKDGKKIVVDKNTFCRDYVSLNDNLREGID